MKAIVHIGPLQLDDPKNYDYRAETMWASKIAHDNSLGVGRIVDWTSHILGHQISAVFDLAHGASLAIMVPAWMKFIYKQHIDRFHQFAVNVFNIEPAVMSRELTAYEGILQLEAFIKRMGLPTRLSEADVDVSKIAAMTERFEGRSFGAFHPLSRADMDQIFELAK
jgi:alcohol dehydrogenase